MKEILLKLIAAFFERFFGAEGAATPTAEKPPASPPAPDRPTERVTQSVRGDFSHVGVEDLKPVLATPLLPYAKDFVEAGHANDLDPRFLASISMLETGRGTSSAFHNKNNAMGISDRNGPIRLSSVSVSIHHMAKVLSRPNGSYRNADTIPEIGAIYSPPGAGNDPNQTNHGWPHHVSKFYGQFLAVDPRASSPSTPEGESDPVPAWYKLAEKEIGVKEIKGSKHHPNIIEYWRDAELSFRDDETPWCAGFVGAMLERAGVDGTASGMARSYTRWGKKLNAPTTGCVVVFWRGSRSGSSGHVGFYAGRDTKGNIMVLGGNQSDAVNIKPFSPARLLGYYWPNEVSLPAAYPHVRTLHSDGRVSTNEA